MDNKVHHNACAPAAGTTWAPSGEHDLYFLQAFNSCLGEPVPRNYDENNAYSKDDKDGGDRANDEELSESGGEEISKDPANRSYKA